MGPRPASVCLNASATARWLLTSTCNPSAPKPEASSSTFGSASQTTTRHPSATKEVAIARPMPLAPPVTTAMWLLRRRSMRQSLPQDGLHCNPPHQPCNPFFASCAVSPCRGGFFCIALHPCDPFSDWRSRFKPSPSGVRTLNGSPGVHISYLDATNCPPPRSHRFAGRSDRHGPAGRSGGAGAVVGGRGFGAFRCHLHVRPPDRRCRDARPVAGGESH